MWMAEEHLYWYAWGSEEPPRVDAPKMANNFFQIDLGHENFLTERPKIDYSCIKII